MNSSDVSRIAAVAATPSSQEVAAAPPPRIPGPHSLRKIQTFMRRKAAAFLPHSPPAPSPHHPRFTVHHSRSPRALPEPLKSRIAPAAIVAHWIGGSGNWSDPAHWDIGSVPNNGGGNTYSAVIDLAGADPAVTIDQGITLSGLTHSEVIHLAAGVTHLSTLLANTGAIDVTGSATLHLTGAFTAPAFGSLSANGGLIKVSATMNLAGTIRPMTQPL